MPAPKGNRFGCDLESFRKPKSYTPDQWSDKFIEYVEHIENKVWNKKEPIKSGERAGELINVPTHAPPSIKGFCVFAGVSFQTFLNYESKEGYEDYFEITMRIRDFIQAAQIEGALVLAYSNNLVARLQGLTDKKENTIKGLELGKAFQSKYED